MTFTTPEDAGSDVPIAGQAPAYRRPSKSTLRWRWAGWLLALGVWQAVAWGWALYAAWREPPDMPLPPDPPGLAPLFDGIRGGQPPDARLDAALAPLRDAVATSVPETRLPGFSGFFPSVARFPSLSFMGNREISEARLRRGWRQFDRAADDKERIAVLARFDVPAAARYAEVDAGTIRRWIADGRLKGQKKGQQRQSRWRIHRKDLDYCLERNSSVAE